MKIVYLDSPILACAVGYQQSNGGVEQRSGSTQLMKAAGGSLVIYEAMCGLCEDDLNVDRSSEEYVKIKEKTSICCRA